VQNTAFCKHLLHWCMVYHWSYAILHRESTCREIWKWSLHTECTRSAGRHCITSCLHLKPVPLSQKSE
jgi:hypothetical protein